MGSNPIYCSEPKIGGSNPSVKVREVNNGKRKSVDGPMPVIGVPCTAGNVGRKTHQKRSISLVYAAAFLGV